MSQPALEWTRRTEPNPTRTRNDSCARIRPDDLRGPAPGPRPRGARPAAGRPRARGRRGRGRGAARRRARARLSRRGAPRPQREPWVGRARGGVRVPLARRVRRPDVARGGAHGPVALGAIAAGASLLGIALALALALRRTPPPEPLGERFAGSRAPRLKAGARLVGEAVREACMLLRSRDPRLAGAVAYWAFDA